MEPQGSVSILATIKADEKADLERVLEAMSQDAAQNTIIPLGRLSKAHFARFVILDEATDLTGAPIPPILAYMSDIDGSVEPHLNELVDCGGDGLDNVFGHCVGYPPPDHRGRLTRLAFLRSRHIEAAVFYVHTIGRTVRQIQQEAELREAIEGFLDRPEHDWPRQTPTEIRAAIQRFVQGQVALSWAKSPEPPMSFLWRVNERFHFAVVILALVILFPVIFAGFPFWLVLLRLHELSDIPDRTRPTAARTELLASLEDHVVQNQLSAVGLVKPGWFRRFTVAIVSWITNFGARHLFTSGSLAGVTTVHFARWLSIDGGKRILFAPNYDGSLEQYTSDFVDRVARGLNAHDSNGVGFPKTSWLFLGGAENEQELKYFVRNHQILTQVWYAAYGGLSTTNIDNNAKIRAGLYGTLTEAATREWLSRL